MLANIVRVATCVPQAAKRYRFATANPTCGGRAACGSPNDHSNNCDVSVLPPPAFPCPGRFLCCAGAAGCAATSSGALGLARQSLSRSRAAAFAFKGIAHSARTCRRWLAPTSPAFGQIALGLTLCPFLAAFRRWQLHARAARFGQTDCDRLLWRSRAVFSLADVFHFFPNEFTGLRGWRKPFAFVLAGAFNYILFWHNNIVSPPRPDLDAR